MAGIHPTSVTQNSYPRVPFQGLAYPPRTQPPTSVPPIQNVSSSNRAPLNLKPPDSFPKPLQPTQTRPQVSSAGDNKPPATLSSIPNGPVAGAYKQENVGILPLPSSFQAWHHHQASTPVSDPPSARSSKHPSPVATPRIDFMESQPGDGMQQTLLSQATSLQQPPAAVFPSSSAPSRTAQPVTSYSNALQQNTPLSQHLNNTSAKAPHPVNNSVPPMSSQSTILAGAPSPFSTPRPATVRPSAAQLPPQSTNSFVSRPSAGFPASSTVVAPPPSMGGIRTSVPSSLPPSSNSMYPPPTFAPQPPPPLQPTQLPGAPPLQPALSRAPPPSISGAPHLQPPSLTGAPPSVSGAPPPFQPPPISGAPPLHPPPLSGASPFQPPSLSAPPPPMQTNPYGQHISAMNNGSVVTSQHSVRYPPQGTETVDLLRNRNILPPGVVKPPTIALQNEHWQDANCSPDTFRCTLTKIPETQSLLQKSRLPLGITIHPFRDLSQLPVITCNTIVRCRSCRTYINPFVYFVDQRRWKCNLCFRINDLPEEFLYDPVTKHFGDPQRRPEVQASTIEYIAPSEYMLRPPQPAVYLFLLDVSYHAMGIGYLKYFCDILREKLDSIPGDSRTQVGIITFNSSVHFYDLSEGLNQPRQIVISDIDDIFLPSPDGLLVNLSERKEIIESLLCELPTNFGDSYDTGSALGAALQAAFKLLSPIGGRVTVLQTCLPMIGPGALKLRDETKKSSSKDPTNLNPQTDFYKKMALDCSAQQIAVDLFVVGSHFTDLATLSGVSKFSGGCIHYFPGFNNNENLVALQRFEGELKRYLTRKIGFEAVMRIRCTRGVSIHTFHGNFFVRSTDLLSLPNANPDAGYGMQLSIEESLSDIANVCFQAALLYTSSKGERRIRVHTLNLPISGNVNEILHSADEQCIIAMLAKMAVDRTLSSSLQDAREAFVNMLVDSLGAFKATQILERRRDGLGEPLIAPIGLSLLPMHVLALLKHMAFRVSTTKLDERSYTLCQMKTLPLKYLLQYAYPDMYPVHHIAQVSVTTKDDMEVPEFGRTHLSAEKWDSHGAYLIDSLDHIYLYCCRAISTQFCTDVLGVPDFSRIPVQMVELPELDTEDSNKLRNFVQLLQSDRPFPASFQVVREDSASRMDVLPLLVEDRAESTLAYMEFLKHLSEQVK